MVDVHALENTNASKSPRGIRGFKLDSGTFSEWKVQGKVGGYTKYVYCVFFITGKLTVISSSYPDKVRGVFNEGGLYVTISPRV
jgi:hypothetical protein